MSSLPQELINHIVDSVALQKCQELEDSESDAMKTLRACSLVSRSFHCQSRKHLFSEVEIYADKSTQKRAKKLFKILDNEANRDLIPKIRGFKLIIDMSSLYSPKIFTSARVGELYRRSLVILSKITLKLGLRTNYLLKIMECLAHSSLESLAIEVRNGYLNWNSVGERATSLFLTMRSMPSLKSLRFINITHLNRPLTVGTEPSNNLRDLVLRNITFSHVNGFPFPLSGTELEYLPGVERLDLQDKTYMFIFPSRESSTLLSVLSGSGPIPPLSQPLPQLKTLIIAFPLCIPSSLLFWEVIKGFSSSLENLEVWDISWPWSADNDEASISLSHLPKLRNLKLSTARAEHDIASKLETLNFILASGTSPLGIQCITLELDIRSRFDYPREILSPSPESSELDKTLTNPTLTNLRKVHVVLKHWFCYLHHGRRNLPEVTMQPIDDSYVRSLFPTVSGSPSIAVEVSFISPSPKSLQHDNNKNQ